MDKFLVNEEAVGHLLHFLSPSDWTVLCLTSNTLRDTIRAVMSTQRFYQRIHHILSHWPRQMRIQCRRLIFLVNSFNFPLALRLQYFTQLTKQMESFLKSDDSIVPTIDLSNWAGTMLQSFMAGCQDDEYRQAFMYVGHQMSIIRSLELFVSSEASVDGCEKSRINENFLRTTVRQLFLDPCPSRRHKATWLGTIADFIGTKAFARFIILLCGPTNLQGELNWNFPLETRSFRRYARVYSSLAETLALLPLIPNWPRSRSTKILFHISNHPARWSLRSFASLLLPLSCLNSDLVFDYFIILYGTGRQSMAATIMALTLTVPKESGLNIHQIPSVMHLSADIVQRMIYNVVDNSRLGLHKSTVMQQLWQAVRNVAIDFAQTAANIEDSDEAVEDFQNLMKVWKELAILQMRSL